jgi:hypothetical protein
MNLAIHGIGTEGLHSRWGDTFVLDFHADKQMDFVMANPPFNLKDWNRVEGDPRWRYGVPPATNANYAWIQHILSKLTADGRAGVVMANGSMSTNSGGEGEIRARIVEADLVSCMVALPTQLFRSTGIPVCLWFFAKDKGIGAQGGSTDRPGALHRRARTRLHGRPGGALARARGHREDRGHLPRVARISFRCKQTHEHGVCRCAGFLCQRQLGGHQGCRLRLDTGPLRRGARSRG